MNSVGLEFEGLRVGLEEGLLRSGEVKRVEEEDGWG